MLTFSESESTADKTNLGRQRQYENKRLTAKIADTLRGYNELVPGECDTIG
jgi:hypothetical protein